MKIAKAQQWFCFAACVVMMTAAAISKEKKVIGYELATKSAIAKTMKSDTIPTVRTNGDTIIINTAYIGKDIKGYGGTTPLEVSIVNEKIVKVKAMKNSETPEFFDIAFSGIKDKWTNKTLAEASNMKIDAVSGATFSSRAIIGNVNKAIAHAQNNKIQTGGEFDFNAKLIGGLIVALMAAILPLYIKNKRYQTLQLILNVAVLGFWTGNFISFTQLIGFLSNGINIYTYLIAVILLITAFIYPLFGKKQYYCSHICPFGSLQQLAGKCNKKHKISLGAKTIHALDSFRKILFIVLMMFLWTGTWFAWMDYELFSAFIIQSAATPIIIAAAIVVILSFFIQRPYCRFICPTGTLFKMSEGIKIKKQK
jgi:uncharacterized protein with FMN-binding domain